MITELKYQPVNWIDGMKVSRRHFQETEYFIHDQVRDAVAVGLTNYNYGILPLPDSLNVQILCDYSQQIHVKLLTCRAITPNGCRVEFMNQEVLNLHTSFKELANNFGLQASQNQQFDLVLTVNPFKRVAVGEPMLDETPPRHPHSLADMKLDLVPTEQVNPVQLSNHLIISRLRYVNGDLQVATEYIPACVSVSSLPTLKDFYNQFMNHLSSFEANTIKIIQKIKEKGQKTPLNEAINELAEKVLANLSDNSLIFQWFVPQQAPIVMLERLFNVVRTIQTFIDCLSNKEKEEILNYISEWADMTPGAFDGQMRQLLKQNYAHTEVHKIMFETDNFYKILTNVFYKLAQLEYIGKRKGQNVFIIEHEVAPEKAPVVEPQQQAPPPAKSRWSPL